MYLQRAALSGGVSLQPLQAGPSGIPPPRPGPPPPHRPQPGDPHHVRYPPPPPPHAPPRLLPLASPLPRRPLLPPLPSPLLPPTRARQIHRQEALRHRLRTRRRNSPRRPRRLAQPPPPPLPVGHLPRTQASGSRAPHIRPISTLHRSNPTPSIVHSPLRLPPLPPLLHPIRRPYRLPRRLHQLHPVPHQFR